MRESRPSLVALLAACLAPVLGALGLLLGLAHSLGKMEPTYDGRSVNEWICLLQNEDKKVRASAANALRNLGPQAGEAVPALLVAFKDEDGDVHNAAGAALAQIGGPAVPGLAALLTDPDTGVRVRAAAALGEIGREAREAVPALAEALHDPQGAVCAAAAAGLGKIGPEAHPAVPELVGLLRGPRLTPPQREWIGRLIGELDSDDYPVRARAQQELEALGRLALAPLRDALTEQPPLEVRRRLEEVLGKTSPKDAEIRRQVVVALGAIGPEARSAATALVGALHDEEPSVVESSAEALAKVGVMDPLVEALRARDPRLRASAARAFLSGPKEKDFVAALVGALKDESVQVRYWAASALGEFGHDAEVAVPALTEALNEGSEHPYRVGERARLSLNKLGHPAEEVDGLKTSLSVGGWQDEGKLRVSLTYRWTHRQGRWVIWGELHRVAVNFWDAEGRLVKSGGQELAVHFDEAFVRMEQQEITFPLAVTVPPQAVSVSIPCEVTGLETRRVPIPERERR